MKQTETWNVGGQEDRSDRLARVLEGSQDGYWEWRDVDKPDLWWSDRFYEILGYVRGEVEATLPGYMDLVHPDDANVVAERITELLESADDFDSSYRLRRKDGSYVWIRARGRVYRKPDGRPTRMAGSIRDITDRLRAEERLVESDARHRQLFEAMLEGFALHEMIWDEDGNPIDYRFLEVNPAFEALTGLERDDLVGRTVLEVMPGTEPEWIQRYGEVARTGHPVEFTSSASELGRHYHVSAFRPAPGQFAVTFTDITDRRTLEAQLRQAQKMEAVGQLTGGIAHDFNNVLAVILATAELVTQALDAGEPVDPDDIRVIADAATRGHNITRKLLGFSRKADLVREPTDLGRLVADMAPILETLVTEAIDLDTRVDGNPDPVLVDRGSVEQMVMNLVANARDATSDGGRIRITVAKADLTDTATLPVAAMEPGTYSFVEVADDGAGMDADTLEHVCEPFFTTQAPGSGTGLGLAMVYGLTKQQGGYVTVDSTVDVGTTSRIYFPAQPDTEGSTPGVAHTGHVATDIATILVVEDEDGLRNVTCKALRKLGHTVLAASDGAEALDVFAKHRDHVDLVLSDLVLPRLGGLHLLERIREEHGPVRFVLTSGYGAGDADARERLEPDAPFLQKPWRIRDLLRVIQAALETDPV